MRLAIMRENILGQAFRRNNDGIVYSNSQCSFTNGQGNCDASAGYIFQVTDMDTSSTYYMCALISRAEMMVTINHVLVCRHPLCIATILMLSICLHRSACFLRTHPATKA